MKFMPSPGDSLHDRMHDCMHRNAFNEVNPLAEKRTRLVTLLTLVMMVIEITAGTLLGSMALLADGWHMSSHAVALGLSAGAYMLARRLARDRRFAFGTWKIEVLGGYTSALCLVGVAAYMAYESVIRLQHPVAIGFNEAIAIAIIGLLVNLLSAWLLMGADHHGHSHGHSHSHAAHDHGHAAGSNDTHGHDLNLRSAYIHVMTDAATSVLAIAALLGGKYWAAVWLDPAIGLVGAVIVAAWAVSLLRDTGKVLLDAEMDAPVVGEIRDVINSIGSRADIQDLHVWRVAKDKYACVISIGTDSRLTADELRALLAVHEELVHITVEINPLPSPAHGT